MPKGLCIMIYEHNCIKFLINTIKVEYCKHKITCNKMLKNSTILKVRKSCQQSYQQLWITFVDYFSWLNLYYML